MLANIKRAAGGNGDLEQILLQIDQTISASTTSAVPPSASFFVQGVDGKFLISITPPAGIVATSPAQRAKRVKVSQSPRGLLYQLRSSTNNIFDAAGNVTTYGPSAQLSWEIQDPNQTKYWELRSSYDGVNWTDWAPFTDPAVCGIVPVWSGMATTGAITNLNAANTPNSQPLSQQGTSTRINVAAFTVTWGTYGTISYAAGFVDPGSYGKYYVYCFDPKRAGGSVVFLASTSNIQVTADDAAIFLGVITTSGGGGGSGDGGGGGPCCVAECLVAIFPEEGVPALMRNDQLKKGMTLMGIDGGREPIERIEVIPNVPCFRYEGENGSVLQGCSSRHSLQYDGGGFDHSWLIISTHRVETLNGPTKVKRTFIGHRTVYKLTLGGATKTYWADGFASHNALKG